MDPDRSMPHYQTRVYSRIPSVGESDLGGEPDIRIISFQSQHHRTYELADDIESNSDGGHTDHKSQDPRIEGKSEKSVDDRLRM